MISYIFKNKINNAIVAVLAAFYSLIKLSELHSYMLLDAWSSVPLKLIALLSPLLIFIYMVTLKREYKLKKRLFPAAFGFLSLTVAFSVFECFNEYSFISLIATLNTIIALIINLILLTGYVFCFIGSLSNFKRTNFLTIGLIICNVYLLLAVFVYLYNFFTFTDFAPSTLLDYLSYLSNSKNLRNSLIALLFHTSILILSLHKKGENIDITPFVEARKIKKEAKKAKKLQTETREIMPPVVPDGFWQCMGCGEILSDNISECQCGYKR